jgi:uncharacterized membrane protein YfcA
MSDNLIITGSTALCSLTAYLFAKNNEHIDRIPAMIIGGFIGSFVGNEIVESDFYKRNRRKKIRR